MVYIKKRKATSILHIFFIVLQLFCWAENKNKPPGRCSLKKTDFGTHSSRLNLKVFIIIFQWVSQLKSQNGRFTTEILLSNFLTSTIFGLIFK